MKKIALLFVLVVVRFCNQNANSLLRTGECQIQYAKIHYSYLNEIKVMTILKPICV